MRFSHVYVENKARRYPLTEEILRKNGDCSVIEIEHYKDVFDRPRQDLAAQKKAPTRDRPRRRPCHPMLQVIR